MQQQLIAAHKTLTGGMLPPAIFAARAIMTPDKFYEEFSPSLNGLSEKRTKKNSSEQERAIALQNVLISQGEHFVYYRMGLAHHHERRRGAPLKELDPRWLDAAVDAESVELVCDLARPGHPAANRFLSDQLAKLKKPHESHRVLQTMVRIGHPGATDAIIDALKKQAKETTYYYLSYWYGRMIADLPKNAHPKFEALLPTLPDKMVDQLMESVLALKNKSE